MELWSLAKLDVWFADLNLMPIRHSTPDPSANTLASYLYKQSVYNRAAEAGVSSETDTNRGTNGTTMMPNSPRGTALVYVGEYDSTSSYGVNDLVSVLTASIYTVNGTDYSSTPGVYLCVQGIPYLSPATWSLLDPDMQAIYADSVNDGTQVIYPVTPSMGYWIQMSGTSSAGGAGVNFSTYNFSSSYANKDFVEWTGSIVMFYSQSIQKWMYPGVYIAVKSVPPLYTDGGPTGSFSGSHFTMPYFEGYDMYTTNSYWHMISLLPTKLVSCNQDGEGKYFWNSNQEFEPVTCDSMSLIDYTYYTAP